MKTDNKVINIAKEFSRKPWPRYIKDGQNSGEEFYNKFLDEQLNSLKKWAQLTVILDWWYWYWPSFLSESFGKLWCELNKSWIDIFKAIEFITDEDPTLINRIQYAVSTYDDKKENNWND